MDDEALLTILLNRIKTRDFMKRVKKKYPDRWLKILLNVESAVDELKDVAVNQSFFFVGVFDPIHSNSWPWHHHYNDGLYLSAKRRLCKLSKSAEFSTPEAARSHFAACSNKSGYKFELIETKKWITLPAGSDGINDWQMKPATLKSVK
ncbi:MAG: hypothetical protein ACJA0H_002470 [Francisellaceae bacterium]|jgi:hypothetical protein